MPTTTPPPLLPLLQAVEGVGQELHFRLEPFLLEFPIGHQRRVLLGERYIIHMRSDQEANERTNEPGGINDFPPLSPPTKDDDVGGGDGGGRTGVICSGDDGKLSVSSTATAVVVVVDGGTGSGSGSVVEGGGVGGSIGWWWWWWPGIPGTTGGVDPGTAEAAIHFGVMPVASRSTSDESSCSRGGA